MSIQKKSLISTLKTAKKANVASTGEFDAKGSKVASVKMNYKASTQGHLKAAPRPAFKTALKASTKGSLKLSAKISPKQIA
jgi:hypothetical protein